MALGRQAAWRPRPSGGVHRAFRSRTLMEHLFGRFDTPTDKYGVCKIVTVGDAYRSLWSLSRTLSLPGQESLEEPEVAP